MSPSAAFYEDIWVVVDDGVYEPADDTFLMCANLDIMPGERMLEIGTGCGLIAILAAKAGANVVATDQSELAVQNARKNVVLHQCESVVDIRHGVFFTPIRPDEKFSLLVFNPPYLPSTKKDQGFDPAWSGGAKGYEVTDQFLSMCVNHLQSNSRLLLIQSSLSKPEYIQKRLEEIFGSVRIREKKSFFFERLLLFEAKNPHQTRH
jgi:release factor glutamine methyltransferase